MTKTKKYVRILKARYESSWYADKIGEVFELTGETVSFYDVRVPGVGRLVNVEDAELIVTEKRPAKVGERILIVDDELGTYNNGQIHKVHKCVSASSDNNEHIVTDAGFVFWTSEYEVIVNNEVKNEEADEMIKSGLDLRSKSAEEIQEFITEALSALRQRARYEGRVQGKADGYLEAMTKRSQKSEEKTAQERRDEIVEQARADIANLNYRTFGELRYSYRSIVCNVEFVINKKKRTVVALLKSVGRGTVESKGIAKAAPDDCFNVHIGEAIALHRALGLEVPDEYLNAPQPTEVRVGDIVKLIHNGEVIDEYRVSKIEDDRVYDHDNTWAPKRTLKIIDDSRTEVDG
ncbi:MULTISPECIES: hypothetical protein [Bacillus subtilis group]|uniref:Uncharacterized protein n=2 Tax=Bacillus sonorensis TaxID=119858 RepID=A0ABM6LEM2_9BACI|nr:MULTISPECIES: hypothetical protein [Bacillus subtilis group]ASB87665.1 hypothetical protein S101395_01129 [Bacillus sonorensis]KRT88674.1 hypothetical protein ACH97_222035 [Bacillus paralicheniformis]RHJ13935.1 hypothetical protein DW143_04970 [Bacillus sonorensis]WPP37658.1 hypothetical protein SK061_05395 [Bacillus sonorensis]